VKSKLALRLRVLSWGLQRLTKTVVDADKLGVKAQGLGQLGLRRASFLDPEIASPKLEMRPGVLRGALHRLASEDLRDFQSNRNNQK